MASAYRRDVDGLRALAVLPILLFHAGFSWMGGGFIGVDIFFVISGFLITSILIKEIDRGSFSIAQFYQRRILRIFPALGVVLVATAVAAYLVLLPIELIEFGKSVLATSLFSSNIFFFLSAGYFEGASEQKPLLHTWSLSVEEQFYVFFPLFLVAISRWLKKNYALWIGIMIAVSFLASIYVTAWKPSAAFYLLPTRIWELGFGSFLAAVPFTNVTDQKIRTALAALGMGLILFALFTFSSETAFPGANALFPCLGSALLIAFGQNTIVGKLLEHRFFVGIGLISYSLYLWHWPVMAFLRATYGNHLSLGLAVGSILLSFALAWASYVLIEQPFRKEKYRKLVPKPVLVTGGIFLFGFSVLGVAFGKFGDKLVSFPEPIVRTASFVNYKGTPEHKAQFSPCFISNEDSGGFSEYDKQKCLPFSEGKKNVLVLGDSHGAHITRALSEAYPDAVFGEATVSGCRPTIGTTGKGRCVEMSKFIYEEHLSGHRYNAVFLVGRWTDGDDEAIAKSIAYLKQKSDKVIVLGPTVEYEGDFPALLARSRISGNNVREFIDPKRKKLDERLRKEVEGSGATYVSVYDIVCPPDQECVKESPEGDPMQFDYGHFTLSGSRFVAAGIHRLVPNL